MSWKYDKDKITYFADTDFRGQRVRFGIRAEDRARHIYIIGKTGMGKSTLLENLAVQDIQNGEGMCFIDPHGGTAELLLKYVPKDRIKDVVYFAPFDMEFPVAMNVLEQAEMSKRPLIASGLLGAFKKVWPDSFSARMEYMLSNTLLGLLEMPGATLLGVNRMLADKAYRDLVISNITDSSVKAFWVDEFGKWTDKMVAEAVPAIQNKVGQFSANPLIRNILGQPESTFDMRWMMDNRKLFIVNLSKGRIGESNAALLGALLITKIYLAAMSRAEANSDELKALPPFYLYVDEFQSFANESFADILSEARKYKLCLTVANQFIEQLTDEVRAAVIGNVGTMITFRVGSTDAEILEKEFSPVFIKDDFVSLGFAQIYLKLMINGASSAPFSARTRDKPPLPEITYENEVLESSRTQFAKPRLTVEKELDDWYKANSTSPNATGNAPQTKKFAPGMRPDRPRFDSPQPTQGGGGGYQSNQDSPRPPQQDFRNNTPQPGSNYQRPTQSDFRSNNPQSGSNYQRPQPTVGGIGLRDALVRVNATGQSSAPISSQGAPQMPSAQPYQPGYSQPSQQPQVQSQPQYGGPQYQYPPVQDQYGNVVQPGNYQGQAQIYSYGPQAHMPVHYGYPYVMPPNMPQQYGYPQMMPYQGQPYGMPMQYPPAPPYGYQPNHPGYGQYMQPQAQPERPLQQAQPVQTRPQTQSNYVQKPRTEYKPTPSNSSNNQNDIPFKDKPIVEEIKKVEPVKIIDQVKPEIVDKPKPAFIKKDDKKGPSAENLDSLSLALAKLQKKVESIPSIEEKLENTEDKKETLKEVPEDVLKKVLQS